MIQLSKCIPPPYTYRCVVLWVVLLHLGACGYNQSIDDSTKDQPVQEREQEREQEQTKPNLQLQVDPTVLVGDNNNLTCSIQGTCDCMDVSQLKLKITNPGKDSIRVLHDNVSIEVDSQETHMLGWKTLGDKLSAISLTIRLEGNKLVSDTPILEISMQYNGSLLGNPYPIYYYKEPSQDLLEAAARGDVKEIKNFLSATPQINELIDQNGNTSIHLVISSGSKQALEELLTDSRWDNIEAENNEGSTPAHLAVAQGKKEMLEVLLKNGIHVNSKNRKGDSLLHEAAAVGNAAIIKFLLIHGANPQVKNKADKTPLDLATQGSHQAAMEILRSYSK